jgi:hypothetical protein
MIRCANPLCGRRTLHLREGGVFLIDGTSSEKHSARTLLSRRTIWLCRSCCRRVKVESWRPPGEQLRSLGPHSSAPGDREVDDWGLPAAS